MGQGKKYEDDRKERVRALLAVKDTISDVAREAGVAWSTAKKWKLEFEAEDAAAGIDENVKSESVKSLFKLREEKKEQFVSDAWRSLERAQRLLDRRLERAEQQEKQIDTAIRSLVALLTLDPENGLMTTDLQEVKRAVATLGALKLDDVGKLSTVIGTLYDKQALAAREPTEIIDGDLAVKRFEEF